jgi:hypothetical protein
MNPASFTGSSVTMVTAIVKVVRSEGFQPKARAQVAWLQRIPTLRSHASEDGTGRCFLSSDPCGHCSMQQSVRVVSW